jgi:hypothetical protein
MRYRTENESCTSPAKKSSPDFFYLKHSARNTTPPSPQSLVLARIRSPPPSMPPLVRVAARQRRLLRPTTAVVPVWLHHGERQRATVGEEEGGRQGLGEERRGGDWVAGRDVRTVEGVRSRFSPVACRQEKEGDRMSGPTCLSPPGLACRRSHSSLCLSKVERVRRGLTACND